MFLIQFPLMSTAQLVRDHVAGIPERSFVSSNELNAPPHAVDCELSRLSVRRELVRIRKGLYWKGSRTRAGMAGPSAMQAGLEVAGDGAGPAEFSAAAALGLTTQIPSVEVVAVPGRRRVAPRGVRFVLRSVERRIRQLSFVEVAVIELLLDGTRFIEVPWSRAAEVVAQHASDGSIRVSVIAEQLTDERHLAARDRWQQLGLRERV